jgi:hypothetical protein
LALLVATMLDVRSANLMELAAGLPLEADRTDMRYQWITRLLGNPLVISDAIMEPFAREALERAAADGQPVVLILDQSKLSDRHQVLMLAVRYGERALPLAWRVEETEGAIGFEIQKAVLEAVAPWLPAAAKVRLMGDRFYGTLIGWHAPSSAAEGQPRRLRPHGQNHDRKLCPQQGLLSRKCRTHRQTGANPHRHHPRSRTLRAMDHRHVGAAGLSAHPGIQPEVGHRADVFRLQVPRLRP